MSSTESPLRQSGDTGVGTQAFQNSRARQEPVPSEDVPDSFTRHWAGCPAGVGTPHRARTSRRGGTGPAAVSICLLAELSQQLGQKRNGSELRAASSCDMMLAGLSGALHTHRHTHTHIHTHARTHTFLLFFGRKLDQHPLPSILSPNSGLSSLDRERTQGRGLPVSPFYNQLGILRISV